MASEGGVPIWYEPVSAAKAVRATSALHMMHYISPNAEELISLAEALSSGPGRPRPTPSEAHKSQTHPSVSLRSWAGQSSSDGSAEAFADGSYRPFLNQGIDPSGSGNAHLGGRHWVRGLIGAFVLNIMVHSGYKPFPHYRVSWVIIIIVVAL